MVDHGAAAIVIFARHPTSGRVKTRLAKDTGGEAAAQFYKTCAEHVITHALSAEGCTSYLFYSLAEEEELVKAWLAPLGQGLCMRPQLQSSVLGDRMYDAMAYCLALGHSKVLIIGTDVPDLHRGIISQAVASLDQHQLVFGPAEDGGYYLMGATVMPTGIFQGIKWGTSTVLGANMDNARQLGLSVAPLSTLPMLADIDTLADLMRWLSAQQAQQGESGLRVREQGTDSTRLDPPWGLQAAAAAARAAAKQQKAEQRHADSQ